MYIHFFKRLFDILIGLCALPFVLIVIICCAPFIYFTDKGPIFYNATRAGKDYKPFKMFNLADNLKATKFNTRNTIFTYQTGTMME